jgi:hypothetical protein
MPVKIMQINQANLQKNLDKLAACVIIRYSLFAIRYSLFAIRYSLFAIR